MLTVDSPGRIDAWSMFKVVLCCSILWGLDSTALEHPFPGWKQTISTSHKTCREDQDSEKQGHAHLHSGEELAELAGARCPGGLSLQGQTVLFCFLTPTSILSRVEDLVRVPHPGTWPETHPADSGWEFGGFMTASRQPRWRSSGRS